ncbi:acyl carrier protein [Actinoplanes campanulatus]|uniref:Acyl carrier protein n=1 Tax=Actinoplanes campanulatus TaxID=113559 RepID=A0A7W5ABD6_9ACTN|nr:acyl carrier protein [Actinoplanes campanulatus]MBB3092839.1 acyl carrier protein [Actinoplanes campanulatus]GGM99388.1 hypothetical protein GCM10010109_04020 [Actinoplanes campanulatus]GID34063.1 hypothetical protein Aca09nite_05690 [Actinoplanes campanulatus]
MASQAFTEDDLRTLLLAVGADPGIGAADYGRSFAELDLDSLARTEIGTRIQDRYGVDVEPRLDADSTPESLRALVNDLAAAN